MTANLTRCFLILLGWVVLTQKAYAQASLAPSHDKDKLMLFLGYQPENPLSLPVNTIEVLDARFNQSIVGSTTGEYVLVENLYTKKDIEFPEGLTSYLGQKLNSWFRPNSNAANKLLILVKDFRTVENITRMLLKSRKKEVMLQVSLSFYLQNTGRCRRVGGTDSWFSTDYDEFKHFKPKKDLHEWIITNVMVNEILKLDFKTDTSQPVFDRREIEKGITQRLKLPIFHEEIRKGVYRSFEQFLRNQPADTSFVIGVDRDQNFIFLDRARVRLNSATTWAVSDGKKTVFMFGENFYEIIRKNNSLRVLTRREVANGKPVSIITDLYTLGLISRKTWRLYRDTEMPDYLDIDMETGELMLEEILGRYKSRTAADLIRKR